MYLSSLYPFFFFNDTATTEIYTLSLHDALPIYPTSVLACTKHFVGDGGTKDGVDRGDMVLEMPLVRKIHLPGYRSEEHTSELQSRLHLVCRLLLEKKKKYNNYTQSIYS